MQAETFTFKAPDGLEVFFYAWLPKGQPKAVVQIAHGMAEHAARYEPTARALTEAGYAVYANDHRGHGKTAKTEDDLGFFAERNGWNKVLGDLHQLSGIVKERHERRPFFLLGHSMGSFFTQHFLFAYPGEVTGAVLSGSSGKPGAIAFLGEVAARIERRRLGPRGKSALLQAMSFGSFNKPFEPGRTPFDWLSRDPAAVDAYIADPRCGFVVSTQLWIDLLGGFKVIYNPKHQARIPSDTPLFVFSGEEDPVSGQGKGVQKLLRSFQAAGLCSVEHKLYPGGRHEMLNEINRDEVLHDLVEWLDRVVAERGKEPA